MHKISVQAALERLGKNRSIDDRILWQLYKAFSIPVPSRNMSQLRWVSSHRPRRVHRYGFIELCISTIAQNANSMECDRSRLLTIKWRGNRPIRNCSFSRSCGSRRTHFLTLLWGLLSSVKVFSRSTTRNFPVVASPDFLLFPTYSPIIDVQLLERRLPFFTRYAVRRQLLFPLHVALAESYRSLAGAEGGRFPARLKRQPDFGKPVVAARFFGL